MEYRGYDSAGIACLNRGKLEIKKEVGKIDDIQENLQFDKLRGMSGVGHTRWATHGKVTKNNAHPHLSCQSGIAVVHNGVIENYQVLRKCLVEEGHTFRSETDTEVISHILEKNYLIEEDEEKAILRTVKQLKGTFAFLAIWNKNSDTIFGARKDAPLIIGAGSKETFLASDVLAFIDHTDQVVFLDNMEIVTVTRNGYKVNTFDGTPVKKDPVKVSWEVGDASKQGFTHYTLKEIYDQPETIKSALNQDEEKLLVITNIIRQANKVFITGSGTSFHAALLMKYLLAKYSKIHAEAVISSEFDQYTDLVDSDTVVLAISQSGETADILSVVSKVKDRGSKVCSIVNAVGSSLVRESYESLYINCGPEIGVAATKSFTGQLAIGYLLVSNLSEEFPRIDHKSIEEFVKEALLVEDKVKSLESLYGEKDVYFIGRGIHHPIALEGALKLKELAYIHAEGMAAGELKHGTLALVDAGTPAVVINPHDETYSETLGNAAEMKARGARIIGVSNEPNELYDDFIKIPQIDKRLYPIIEVIPLQILSYYAAIYQHRNPDFPRNLAKSVTVK